ncbi:hypothetical protein RCO28_36205 [Streptomyces sp. LHD-70]|uniref:hypothetical protein n=1 Tax=Streptomyces sp. LHD-70 TaxID=3072140 RepID=UPI0028104097|nr:hypothetical protein [Streptomyces sp. LHD-70]MDQ8707873.1 hypothetical protein [Streptomyces sp. LHD-70]
MTTPQRFQVAVKDGVCNLAIDGHDITDAVASFEVRGEPGAPPCVVLHLVPGDHLPAVLDTAAHVVVGEQTPPGLTSAEFIDALDPVEVERAALARSDLDNTPAGGTAAVLRQLSEWARGA